METLFFLLLFSHPVMSDSLRPHGLPHARPPYPSASPKFCHLSKFAITQSLPSPKVWSSCPLHCWWCHPAISSSGALFSFCPQSFPASVPFPISQLSKSDDQNTRISVSASLLPMSVQDWFPLILTGLISLLSKGFSGVFSTKVWRHQFFSTLPSLLCGSHNCTWPLGTL